MKNITVLGATGSIGVNTLDVIARHPDRFCVFALTANTQVERIFQQCVQFNPKYAVMAEPDAANKLQEKLKQSGLETEVLAGEKGLITSSTHQDVDYVMAAIVGAAGLMPTLEAVKKGKRILLANKEALVMSGKIFMDAVREHKAELLPIDSEHNAVFQSMPDNYNGSSDDKGIKRVILTASGGPFRDREIDTLEWVTPDEACAHPNWDMGRKISVDSATMMNKGLEVIEACWLFNMPVNMVDVAMHPQSIIHSMVEYDDGSILSQMGQPDMRTPIAHAMAWPDRIVSGVDGLDLFSMGKLEFKEPDFDRFPCLRLAYEAMSAGGTQTAILNAANEIAVDAFLNEDIKFTDIHKVIENALKEVKYHPAESLQAIIEDDQHARQQAKEYVNALRKPKTVN